MTFLCIASLTITEINGQIGFKAGVGISNFYYNGNPEPTYGYEIDLRPYFGYDIGWVQLQDQKPLYAPYLGVYYDMDISKNLIFRPAISFTQKGINFSSYDYERMIYKIRLSYLDIPLSVAWRFVDKEKFKTELMLGGYCAFKLSAVKIWAIYDSDKEKTKIDNCRVFDYGLRFGLGFKPVIKDQRFRVDIVQSVGFGSIFFVPEDEVKLYDSVQKVKNMYLAITLAYEININK
jgi:hypothetical protein